MRTLVLLVALLMSPVSYAQTPTPEKIVNTLTTEQAYLLEAAYHVGELIGYPETLQAILMQESLAGKLGRVNRGPKKVAYGVTQVRPSTAIDMVDRHSRWFDGEIFDKDVAGFYFTPRKNEAEYQKALLENDMFSLFVSAITIKDLMVRTGNWRQGIVAYYEGFKGSTRFANDELEEHFYFKQLSEKLKVVRLFNKRRGLS